MRIGNKNFEFGRHTYIMGILNVTPDSFSDGGRFNNLEAAVNHAHKMILEGADIIDVGGESTRPNYKKISIEEEIRRTSEIIKALKKMFDVPISIDTYKSEVAQSAIESGADLVNDIWGLKYDEKMAQVIKKNDVPVCIMHNRKDLFDHESEEDFILQIKNELAESISIAKQNSIDQNKIIIDPGVGFGKTYQQNLLCIKNIRAWKELGLPVLLGASRKSVIGIALNLPVHKREEATLAISTIAAINHCDIVRVHDVEKNRRAILMAQAIYNNGGENEPDKDC